MQRITTSRRPSLTYHHNVAACVGFGPRSGCGTLLSRYNPQDLCGPCARLATLHGEKVPNAKPLPVTPFTVEPTVLLTPAGLG